MTKEMENNLTVQDLKRFIKKLKSLSALERAKLEGYMDALPSREFEPDQKTA